MDSINTENIGLIFRKTLNCNVDLSENIIRIVIIKWYSYQLTMHYFDALIISMLLQYKIRHQFGIYIASLCERMA